MGGSERTEERVATATLSRIVIVGVVAYIAIDVVLRVLRPGYSIVYNAESDYGRGPWFWVMDFNFLLRGAVSIALVIALHRVAQLTPLLRRGLQLVTIWAVASGLLAFFADDVEGTPATRSGSVHLGLALIAFVAVCIGTVVCSVAVRADPGFTPALSNAMAVVSGLGVVAVLLLGSVAHHHHAPGGLFERIFLALELLWVLIAAVATLRLSHLPAASKPAVNSGIQQ